MLAQRGVWDVDVHHAALAALQPVQQPALRLQHVRSAHQLRRRHAAVVALHCALLHCRPRAGRWEAGVGGRAGGAGGRGEAAARGGAYGHVRRVRRARSLSLQAGPQRATASQQSQALTGQQGLVGPQRNDDASNLLAQAYQAGALQHHSESVVAGVAAGTMALRWRRTHGQQQAGQQAAPLLQHAQPVAPTRAAAGTHVMRATQPSPWPFGRAWHLLWGARSQSRR